MPELFGGGTVAEGECEDVVVGSRVFALPLYGMGLRFAEMIALGNYYVSTGLKA